MTLLSVIFGLFRKQTPSSKPTGAEAIIVDYQERQNMVADGHEAEGELVSAERIVDEGVFQSNAVAQLWFDLDEYGTYPVTLDLPDGPGDDSELEAFMDRLGLQVEDLNRIVGTGAVFPFIRVDGEWQIDWHSFEQSPGDSIDLTD